MFAPGAGETTASQAVGCRPALVGSGTGLWGNARAGGPPGTTSRMTAPGLLRHPPSFEPDRLESWTVVLGVAHYMNNV